MFIKTLLLTSKLLIIAATFLSLSHFCNIQTKGFRPYLILSNLPNELRWEVPPLTETEQQNINTLLDQSFTYLGSGGWCFAFLGEDQKTVLKFYKHDHLRLPHILSHFHFQNLLLKSAPWPKETPYFQEFNFNSCTLLYKEAKELTGLLYVHLNKTKGLHKPVTLIDNIGICHTIDLDQTEFLVQKKADLLIPHIDRLAKEETSEEAKRSLDQIIDCLLTLYKRGIRDLDQSFRNNFGYTQEGAIALDLSSYTFDESLKNPEVYKKELIRKTQRLSRFLRKNHPDLFTHYENRLKGLIEND